MVILVQLNVLILLPVLQNIDAAMTFVLIESTSAMGMTTVWMVMMNLAVTQERVSPTSSVAATANASRKGG